MRIPLLAAVLAGAPLQAHAQNAPNPSYRWVEASYGGQNVGVDGVGYNARDTVRLAANAEVMPHLYLLGSYTDARYPATPYSSPIAMGSAGIGTYAELAGSAHGIVQVTYEVIESDTFEEDGLGVEAGLRLRAEAVEFGLSAEYLALETDFFGPTVDDRYVGANLIGLVPITARLGIAVRMEWVRGVEGPDEDVEFRTYLVGVRYTY